MFTTTRMAYQHNRTGSRALCFEMKSNKSLKTSKIYKISKNSKVSKRWLDLQALQGSSGLCFEMKLKQKSKNGQNIQDIQKTPKYPKLQNIRWTQSTGTLTGSAGAARQWSAKVAATCSREQNKTKLNKAKQSWAKRAKQTLTKQSWAELSKVELNKAKQTLTKQSWAEQNKTKQSEKKNKARPASAQLASWVWCPGDDQRLNAIYEGESSTDDLVNLVKARQRVVVLWDDPHHHDSQSASCLSK